MARTNLPTWTVNNNTANRMFTTVEPVRNFQDEWMTDLIRQSPIIDEGFTLRNPDLLRRREQEVRVEPIRPRPVPQRAAPLQAQYARPTHAEAVREFEGRPTRSQLGLNFQIGQKSKLKADGFKERFKAAMIAGLPYTGRTLTYRLDPIRERGTWSINDTPVAEVDTQQIRLCRIMLPDSDATMQNRARFLWRQLGVSAVRYKDTTVIEVGGMVKSMKPGESCTIPFESLAPYVVDMKQQLKQLELDLNGGIAPQHLPGTKPVGWERPDGRPFLWGNYSYTIDGRAHNFPLNNPPRPAAESST